jgi:hypothetical protein
MRCVWVQAFERSQLLEKYAGEMADLQPPVNHRLQGTSAWINDFTGLDKEVPAGWVG